MASGARPIAKPGALSVLAVLAWAGCSPSLATLQPAHVPDKGHVAATAGFEVGIPTGTITKLTDAAQTLSEAAGQRELTNAEILQLFDAAVNLATSPPSVGPHFALAYSVLDRTEVGLRYAAGAWRLGGRYQLMKRADGPLDMMVGLGVSRATTPFPVHSVVDAVELRDFTRWTFDVPLLFGTSRSWFRTWFGPKLVYTRFDAGATVSVPMNPDPLVEASLNGSALYVLGQGGFAVGYEHVFLALELTMGQLTGSAEVTIPQVVDQRKTDISGFVVYPAIALLGEF